MECLSDKFNYLIETKRMKEIDNLRKYCPEGNFCGKNLLAIVKNFSHKIIFAAKCKNRQWLIGAFNKLQSNKKRILVVVYQGFLEWRGGGGDQPGEFLFNSE